MTVPAPKLRVILTGATGMVGEGVLLECLAHPAIAEVLTINRKPLAREHPKLRQLIVKDLMHLENILDALKGYDACLFCAGISSFGMKEAGYTRVTYDITLHFAEDLAHLNPGMIFGYVSGAHTDTSEQGKVMWARVKGRTENALLKLPFKRAYCYRPGLMRPSPGQENLKFSYKAIGSLYPILRLIIPNQVSTLKDVGVAMINTILTEYPKQILEVRDLNALAQSTPST